MIKRIERKQDKEKKKQRNQLIVGFVLIGIMLLSTAGYAISNYDSSGSQSSQQTVNYNGIQFVNNNGYWQFQKNGAQFVTKYNPNQVSELNVSGDFSVGDYQNQTLYVIGDDLTGFEISRNLNSQVLRIQGACLDKADCKDNLPIKNCLNDNIIDIRQPGINESESVFRLNKCAFIIANSANQTEYADGFLFKTLKI